MNTQELGAHHSLHHGAINAEWKVASLGFPEGSNSFFVLSEIIVLAPDHQLFHPLHVCHVLVVSVDSLTKVNVENVQLDSTGPEYMVRYIALSCSFATELGHLAGRGCLPLVRAVLSNLALFGLRAESHVSSSL